MVGRDGLEPPTPGFPGLKSASPSRGKVIGPSLPPADPVVVGLYQGPERRPGAAVTSTGPVSRLRSGRREAAARGADRGGLHAHSPGRADSGQHDPRGSRVASTGRVVASVWCGNKL